MGTLHPVKLMRLTEVPIRASDRVFRHSPARALVVAVSMLCASAGLAWFGSGLAYYVAAVLVVSLLVMHKLVLARLRPSNWLARMNNEGLFLHFRSYLNHHFPATDLTVVFIPYAEIRSANATLYKDYPVRMTATDCIQVAWNVVPDADAFLTALGQHANIAPAAQKSIDYVNLENQPRAEQEKRLLELIEAGQTIDAIYIARKLYSYDLTQAREFVEELRGGKKGRAAL
jgi:hypothetical protein